MFVLLNFTTHIKIFVKIDAASKHRHLVKVKLGLSLIIKK